MAEEKEQKKNRVLEKLNELAMNGNDDASELYEAAKDLDEREFAEFVLANDADLRAVLPLASLAEKEGDPGLVNEYFEALNLGKSIRDPDPYVRHDYYGKDLNDVDYWMGELGVAKPKDGYTNEMRAAFTNPESDSYFRKADPLMIKSKAQVAGMSPEQYLDQVDRVSTSWQNERSSRGYNADNTVNAPQWAFDAIKMVVAPRVREAHLAGREASIEDFFGDFIELGLNFVPGTGLVSRATGKVVASWPATAKMLASLGVSGVEAAAVPVGSQLMDMALYDDTDPRGNWNTERVAAQYGGALAAKGMLKMGARSGKNAAELAYGDDAAKSGFRSAMDAIGEIGNDARNNIAQREASMKAMGELAKDARYARDGSFLTPEQNRTGVFATPEYLKNAKDFEIRAAEAERLAKSQKAREAYAKAEDEYYKAANEYGETFNEAKGLEEKREAALARKQAAEAKMNSAKEDFIAQNKADRQIVQLPDGKFAYKEGGIVSNNEAGANYYMLDNLAEPLPKKVTVLKEFDEGVPARTVTNNSGQEISYAPRDPTVRKALQSDKDFATVASGAAGKQKYVNTGANVLFNAGAREGLVGQGFGDMTEKREAALWNQTMNKLRPLVADSNKGPEEKRRTVNAIMNVMYYGLDNLPEETYRRDRVIYRDIARILGSDDWSHWSDHSLEQEPGSASSSTSLEQEPGSASSSTSY